MWHRLISPPVGKRSIDGPDVDPSMQLLPYAGPKFEPNAILLIVLSGVGLLLIIQPLAWHAKHRNMPAASLVAWLLVLNLMNFTNALIWPNDNVDNWFDGVGLCDIQVKITVGSYVGINTALCGIARSLSIILDSKQIGHVPTEAQRRRELAIQWLLVWGFPVLLMILHYIVQPNRYYLLAISGCQPSFDSSWLSIFLVFVWPVVFALASCYYAVLLVWRLQKYRKEFERIMTLNRTTKSRFVRLFALSGFLILAFVPLSIWVFYENVDMQLHPYSWSNVHGPLWNFPLPVPTQGFVVVDRWFRPAAAFVAFLFFGVGRDAAKMYKGMLVGIGFGRLFPSLVKRPFSEDNSASNTSARHLRSKTQQSRFRSGTAASDNINLTRTSISTGDVGSVYEKENLTAHSPRSHASMPSPIRMAVNRGDAVAVQTQVTVQENSRGAELGDKHVWET